MSKVHDTGGFIGASYTYPNAPPAYVTSGLILFLDAANTSSYPGTGTTWFDLSGNGRNTTLFNTPTWSSTNGGTFSFNGSSNQYAQAPTSVGSADYTSGITTFFIVNFGATAGNYERILDWGPVRSSTNTDALYVCRFSTGSSILFGFANGGTYRGDVTFANGISENAIASYCFTHDNSNVRFYRNSSLLGTTSYPYTFGAATRDQNYIGKSAYTGDSGFEGAMYVFLIYNRALSQAEITQNYNAFKGRYGLA